MTGADNLKIKLQEHLYVEGDLVQVVVISAHVCGLFRVSGLHI